MRKPCTVQVFVQPLHSEGEWRDADHFGSVKAARRGLVSAAYRHVDRLSSAWYELRLLLADGTVRPLTQAQQDWALETIRSEQYYNSIGQRLSRGEAVAV